MSRTQDQRYLPTDLRSQVIHFLWSIGFKYEKPRSLMADVILGELRLEQEWDRRAKQECESANSTSSPSASLVER